MNADGSYYYFSRLTEEQKALYKTILSSLKTYSKEIKMQLRPTNEILKVFNYVLLDNPLIFYTSSFRQMMDLDKRKCSVMPEYKYPKNFSKETTATINNYLQVFDSIKGKNDLDKETYVHDYCLKNFNYDYSLGDYSYSVLGAVLNKTSACEGIAKFVKLAFDYLGLKSLVVCGKAKNQTYNNKMEPHAWNIIKLNGKTYHLDVTFDMASRDKSYFNLSDEIIKRDHIVIGEAPACK